MTPAEALDKAFPPSPEDEAAGEAWFEAVGARQQHGETTHFAIYRALQVIEGMPR